MIYLLPFLKIIFLNIKMTFIPIRLKGNFSLLKMQFKKILSSETLLKES